MTAAIAYAANFGYNASKVMKYERMSNICETKISELEKKMNPPGVLKDNKEANLFSKLIIAKVVLKDLSDEHKRKTIWIF